MLSFGQFMISSQEGAQQGDPLGPLLFCLTIHPIISSLSSQLSISYMDDLTLGGPSEVVAQDVKLINEKGSEVGLQLNAKNAKSFTSLLSQRL